MNQHNSSVPTVVIWMVTYNQEKLISKTIESILAQKTSFEYKLYIGEDCSTDNTAEICLNYQRLNKTKIEIVCNNTNLGALANGILTHKRCFESGAKFIALCEGDDYWIDPNKLQKQVTFLQENLDYSLCFHNVLDLKNNNLIESRLNRKKNETLSILDLSKRNFIQTNTVVFRNENIVYPEFLVTTSVGDYPLFMYLAKYGKLYCIAESMAVYRVNSGHWSSQDRSQILEKWLAVLAPLIEYFTDKDVKALLIKQQFATFNALVSQKYAHLEPLIKENSLKNCGSKYLILNVLQRITKKLMPRKLNL